MNKALILVVEDDRPIRNLIVTTLKTHDYKYITAENGSSAILEASSHKPEIILLDLGLPDMEGVDAAYGFKTRKSVCSVIKYNILKRKISGRYISVLVVIMQNEKHIIIPRHRAFL